MKYNLLVLGILLYSCAAEGTAGGGPLDETGPKIIGVSPNPDRVVLSGENNIEIRFDELIDPLSVPASIRIRPELDVLIKTRGKVVEIHPESPWPKETIVHISISRKIRDYQANKMAASSDLYYSTGGVKAEGEISGNIFNFAEKTVVELGLFALKESLEPELVRVIEADENGEFVFKHVSDGKYIVGCIEGTLSDFSKDFRTKRYGIQSADDIIISNGSHTENISIWMDEPVERMSIKSIQFKNSEFGLLVLTDGSTIPYTFSIPNEADIKVPLYEQRVTLNPGDSLSVSVDLENRLEKYQTLPYWFIVPSIQDSVPPEILQNSYEENGYFIHFSEPVLPVINDDLFMCSLDSITSIGIGFQFKKPEKILVDFSPAEPTSVDLHLWKLQDYFGNSFQDSVFTFVINPPVKVNEQIEGGSIKGIVNYNGPDSLVVEAKRVDSDSRYYTIGKSEFNFNNIEPGDYTFKAFEKHEGIEPDIYFSGLWEPFQRAAQMGMCADTIEVRKRWTIEGVRIEMK
ncbi:MAG: Ig-like domain-containing protein [Fidelibacterota bacterium]